MAPRAGIGNNYISETNAPLLRSDIAYYREDCVDQRGEFWCNVWTWTCAQKLSEMSTIIGGQLTQLF